MLEKKTHYILLLICGDNMKKGFTLIEILAVIAILAIIATLAIMNITSLFRESKEKAFITQAQLVYNFASDEYASKKLLPNSDINTSFCNIVGNEISMTVSSNVKYIIKFTNDKISSFRITDGVFSYKIKSFSEISATDSNFKKENIDAINSCD